MRHPALRRGLKNAVDLIATSAGVAAWKRRRRSARGGSVILAYHQVTDEVQHPDHAAELIVATAEFASHARHLAHTGRVVSLDAAIASALTPSPGPPRLALTFDDGYAGVYEFAFPILKDQGLPFAVFLTAGVIGTDRTLPGEERFQGVRYPKLTWDQVGRMAEWGATIGAHGVTHRRLSAVPISEAEEEIARSKEVIEKRVGRPVVHFAYPYGGPADFTEETERLIERAGYRSAFLCAGAGRPPENRFRIDRAPVWRGISSIAFRNLCDGADTAGLVTSLSRRLRGEAVVPRETGA